MHHYEFHFGLDYILQCEVRQKVSMSLVLANYMNYFLELELLVIYDFNLMQYNKVHNFYNNYLIKFT